MVQAQLGILLFQAFQAWLSFSPHPNLLSDVFLRHVDLWRVGLLFPAI